MSPFVVEVFAGSGRFSRAASRRGHLAVLIDSRFGEDHDIRLRRVRGTILHWISAGVVLYMALALPCASWTRARNRGGGPQRLRTRDELMGVSELRNEAERWKIELGNLCMAFGVHAARLLHRQRCGFFIENPWTSWLWQVEPMQRLARAAGIRLVRADFCQFGTPWRKATGFLTNGPVQFLDRRCCGPRGICSRTGRPHQLLQGTDAHGRFITSLAEPYPRPLCSSLVQMLEAYQRHAGAVAMDDLLSGESKSLRSERAFGR